MLYSINSITKTVNILINVKRNKVKSRVDPVEVYCRQRPLPDGETESCLKILDENSLLLQVPEVS